MKSIQSSPPQHVRYSRAFSLLEIISAVTLIAIIASVAVVAMGSSKTAVQSAKLKSDVAKLNEIVSVYLANGGSLTGLTTPQAVIDKLKTTVSADDARRNVGVMTGRGVDIRLTANMQTAGDAATGAPRVTWDGTKQAFVYSSSPGAIGVSAFALNDSLASGVPATETRAKSVRLYNGSNGWVWGAGSYSYTPLTPLGPANVPVTDMSNVYSPVGGISGGSAPYTLPSPIVSPGGGAYPQSMFPSLIYLNPNGAPDGSSILKYSINNGPWMVYTGPFSVASGSTVIAQNVSTNTASYTTSASASQSFALLTTAGPYVGSTDTPLGLTTNWNKCATGNILWMTSNFNVTKTMTDGEIIYFTGVTVSFPFNGATQVIQMPSAQITFSASCSSATSNYDPASNTWYTTVPLGTSGQIFLTGFGWQIPSPGIPNNISGNQVGMNGTFSSNASHFGVQWQWQTAAYLNSGTNLDDFTVDMNNLGVKLIADSYQAGTPMNNLSPAPISGGSGGGSSNYTGGHSGTATVVANVGN